MADGDFFKYSGVGRAQGSQERARLLERALRAEKECDDLRLQLKTLEDRVVAHHQSGVRCTVCTNSGQILPS